MIKKQELKNLIEITWFAKLFFKNKKVNDLLIELLKMWDENKLTNIDLLNAFGRALYPEKKEE